MLKLFNLKRPSFPTPPTLPAAVIDSNEQTLCASAPPNGGI
jgi:hypothetical protein